MNDVGNTSLTGAIVQPPSPNFAAGLTTVDLGTPVFQLARKQHAAYCEALQSCGLTLTWLPAEPLYPDATFVEDTAILTDRCAILTRPGALTRTGEVSRMEEVLSSLYSTIHAISEPGTLDGGDVCQAGDHFFIGISRRTNEAGGQQLADLLADYDYASSFIDVREVRNILHLKSGLAYLGDNRLVVIEAIAGNELFADYEQVVVAQGEEYAANCVRVNNHVLIASGFPGFEKRLHDLGYQTLALEMSEFQKMDGGLSCLSLRYDIQNRER
jgi:dimethylargininase